MLSSSVGIERRDPLASLSIVQFHFSTPERIRLRSNQFRLTHREAVKPITPGRVMDRSDKAHFSETIRRHLPQFEDGGAFALSDVAPGWVDPGQVARYMIMGRDEAWPLWAVWSLFGCALAGKSRKSLSDHDQM